MNYSRKDPRELTHPVVVELLEGNKRWVTTQDLQKRRGIAETALDYIDLQNPIAVIVTCADSRVIPEFLFDTGIGKLFVIRVAGNVITEEVAASVEFAVIELDVEVIFILGHQNCGAVNAKIQYERDGSDVSKPNLEKLYSRLHIVSDDGLTDVERYHRSIESNIVYQHDELHEMSDVCDELASEGKLMIIPAIYKLDTREVEILQ